MTAHDKLSDFSGLLPRECTIRERSGVVIATVRVFIGISLYAIALILVAWLVEYFINEVNFVSWIVKRWYIPILIIFFTLQGRYSSIRKKRIDWHYLQELSSNIDDSISAKTNDPYATGVLAFAGNTIGAITVSTSVAGIIIWVRGAPKVFFPWPRIEKIETRNLDHEFVFADVTLKWTQPNPPPELRLPWSAVMDRKIPNIVDFEHH